MLTCKLALQSLQLNHEWLAALGYKLLRQPEGFSPAALLSHLLQDPAYRYAPEVNLLVPVFTVHRVRVPPAHRAYLYYKQKLVSCGPFSEFLM